MKRVFRHLGYPKTGTTTLQRQVFHKLAEARVIRYPGMFGCPAGGIGEQFFNALTELIYLPDSELELRLDPIRRMLTQIDEANSDDQPLVISNEHFVLSQWSTTEKGRKVFARKTACFLAKVFAGYKVDFLICFRRQDALLRSMYLEHASRSYHVNSGKYRGFENYFALCTDDSGMHSDFYDFAHTVDCFQTAFPEASFLAWTFERFEIDQAGVVEEVLAFIGVTAPAVGIVLLPLSKMNTRTGSGSEAIVSAASWPIRLTYQLPYGRKMVYWLSRFEWLRSINRFIARDEVVPALTPGQRATLLRRFSVSNSRLSDLLPAITRDAGYYQYGKVDNDAN
jgi:hypothetical protein